MRRSEVLLAVGALLGPVAAVAALVAGTRVGIAVLGVAFGVVSVGLLLTTRRTYEAVIQLHRGQRRLRRRVDRGVGLSRRALRVARRQGRVGRRAAREVVGLGRTTRELVETRPQEHHLLTQTHQAAARLEARLQADHQRFRTSFDTLPSDILRLTRRTDQLAPDAVALPGLGDWAVTPATLLTMLDELFARSGPVTILECGSGSSTLFFALALAQRGQGGRVVALESDAVFAEETRGHLRRNGVDHLATVVDAPLADLDLGTEPVRPWFDIAGLPDVGPIDILFVDGPVGGSTYHARYPAYPVLGDRLAPGAMVVLDDTDRPHESAIVQQWLDEPVGAHHLRIERTNVRSTFFRVTSDA